MRKWKRFVSGLLAGAMVLGLTACSQSGGFSGFGGGNKETDNNPAVSAKADISSAKESVYRLENFDLSKLATGSDASVIKALVEDEKVYAVLRVYDENWQAGYQLISMNQDGTDLQTYEFQTEPEGESEQVNDVMEPVAEGGVSNTYEYVGFNSFILEDGCLYAQKSYSFEDYSDPDNYVYERQESIVCWDLEGKLLWETVVPILGQDESWYYVNAMTMLSSGNIGLLISGDENGLVEVKQDGTVSEIRPMENLKDYFANPGVSIPMADGKLLLTYYDKNWTSCSVVTYEINQDKISAPFPLPATMTYSGMSNLCVDEKGDMIYCGADGVYKYHIGDMESKLLMSFVNSDLNITYLDAILPLNREQFIAFYSEYDEKDYKRSVLGGMFTKVAPEDIPDKEILVLGGYYVNSDITKRVVEYNKSSNTHRITIKDYSQYNTNEDYSAGKTQLNNDIIAGNMPDILVVDPYQIKIESYASKGLLADVGDLMAKDSEISANTYMENVFEACKINDTLYEIVPAFYVTTYAAKSSIVGDKTNWSMEEARAILDRMPEGTSLFGDMTRDSFMYTMMETCGSDFVDVSTGKCNFNSPEFIAMMEYAKTLPESTEGAYDDDWYLRYESQYREERVLLYNCYISSMQNMVYTINGSFGEDISLIGMPTSGGQGAALHIPTSYVLSAQSENLDVAWDFMKYYLTDEYQDTIDWQLPVSKSHFDKLAAKATDKNKYTDADGVEVVEDYTYWINDESIVIDPLTKEQVDEISQYIAGITTKAYNNNDVTNIISEEMPAFYEGQKSAAEVADVIQSRIQLYVNENR